MSWYETVDVPGATGAVAGSEPVIVNGDVPTSFAPKPGMNPTIGRPCAATYVASEYAAGVTISDDGAGGAGRAP